MSESCVSEACGREYLGKTCGGGPPDQAPQDIATISAARCVRTAAAYDAALGAR